MSTYACVGAEYQTENRARRHLEDAFASFDGFVFVQRCLIHPHGGCKTALDVHHLDQAGKGDPNGWFFENLIPLCSGLNQIIERQRPQEYYTEPELSPEALDAWYRYYRNRGELIEAYAIARLGAFLYTPTDNRRDIGPALQYAAKSVLPLRGVDPTYAVPLAIDTLDRTILPILRARTVLDDRLLVDIASAIGSFRRDYGQPIHARPYYALAGDFAQRAALSLPDAHLVALVNHWRILYEGTGNTRQAKAVERILCDAAGYGKTPHEENNLLLWRHPYWSGHTRGGRRTIGAFLEQAADLRRRQFSGPPSRSVLKPKAMLDRWDFVELTYRIADAHMELHGWARAEPFLHEAAEWQERGRFAINGLAVPTIFRTISERYTTGAPFSFRFRTPDLLDRVHRRTVHYNSVSCNAVSATVYRLLEKHARGALGASQRLYALLR